MSDVVAFVVTPFSTKPMNDSEAARLSASPLPPSSVTAAPW
jgi:hypothetical protein